MFKCNCFWIFAVVFCVSSSVWSQSDVEDWSDEDELTNNLEALFDNSFDYDETLNVIEETKEQEFHPDYVEEDEPVVKNEIDKKQNIDEFKDSLQVEDVRFDSSKDENNNHQKYEYKEEIVNDENMNGNAPINDYDPNEYNDYVENVIMKSPEEKPIILSDQLFNKKIETNKDSSEEIETILRKADNINSEYDSKNFEEDGVDSDSSITQQYILEYSETLLNENNTKDDRANTSDQSDYAENENQSPKNQLQNISQPPNSINYNENLGSIKVNITEQDEDNSEPLDVPHIIHKETQESIKENFKHDISTNEDNIDGQIDEFYKTHKIISDNEIQNIIEETKAILAESEVDNADSSTSDDSEEMNEEVKIPQTVFEETNALLNENTSNVDEVINEIENSADDLSSNNLNQQLSELWKIKQELQNNDYNNGNFDEKFTICVDSNDNQSNDDDQDNLGLKDSNENGKNSYDNDEIQTYYVNDNLSSYVEEESNDNMNEFGKQINNQNISNDHNIQVNATPDESGENVSTEVKEQEDVLYSTDQNLNDDHNYNLDESIRLNPDVKYYSIKTHPDLKSQELYNFIHERGTILKQNFIDPDISPVHYKLSLDKPVLISSPNYPKPYNGTAVVDWFFDGEDANGIELNIIDFTVDGNSGDYLLVKPGKSDIYGGDGLIFTYMLPDERRYKFLDVDRLFVRFESKGDNAQNFRGFQFSVKFIEPKTVRIVEPEPLPEPSAQVPAETLTLHLTGLVLYGAEDVLEEFRSILTDMAYVYIEAKEIELGELPLDEVVQLTSVASCSMSWPHSETCAAVTFGVPLYYNDDRDYGLTKEQMAEMWSVHAAFEPFSSKLRAIGIDTYDVPNERRILSAWCAASFVSLMVVLGVGYAIWRCNCSNECNGMTRLRDDDSIHRDRKSDLSLYPTPHQSLPPMFPDSQQYEKYLEGDFIPDADTTRVDMGGAFTNKSFVRDGKLMDLDSDDEIIMSLPDDGKSAAERKSYTSVIRPRDVYDA